MATPNKGELSCRKIGCPLVDRRASFNVERFEEGDALVTATWRSRELPELGLPEVIMEVGVEVVLRQGLVEFFNKIVPPDKPCRCGLVEFWKEVARYPGSGFISTYDATCPHLGKDGSQVVIGVTNIIERGGTGLGSIGG